MTIDWSIQHEGRAWSRDEALQRFELTPERIELIDGKLLADEQARLVLLGLLLENVGVDAAVKLGTPAVWREAIARLP